MADRAGRGLAVNDMGHLVIGGCDAVELARVYGTPLYVLDEARVRAACREYVQALRETYPHGRIVYAGKALLTVGLCRIIEEEGLGLDVVSGGELYTALTAGFPPERIWFHGNNKSGAELALAVEAGVGQMVVDNLGELERLEAVAADKGRVVDVLLRVTPGVLVNSHSYVQTGQPGSKFGLPIADGTALAAARRVAASPWLRLAGYHCHIGSQVLDLQPYDEAVDAMAAFMAEAQRETGVSARQLNMGGGLGIRYCDETDVPTPAQFVARIARRVLARMREYGLPAPELVFEPGRSIVGPAGVTLYTVGFVKRIAGMRTYVFIDGGMGDNPRVALYGTRYYAVVANKMNEPPAPEPVAVAGKYCESGDVLIHELYAPPLEPGDILAVTETGAYNYSMASNYNRLPRPAMVLVRDGLHALLVERETYEDLVRKDVVPPWLDRASAAAGRREGRAPGC